MSRLLEFAGDSGKRGTATERQPNVVGDAKKTKGLVDANLLTLESFGAAGRNRTHDPLVRSQVLYPAELQPLWKNESISQELGQGHRGIQLPRQCVSAENA